MEPRFFISYSREDARFVRKLSEDIQTAGMNVWLDEDRLDPGNEWQEEIADGIAESAAVLLVLSPASVGSSWVLQEVSYANRQRKHFFPIVCAPTKLPRAFEFAVGGAEWIDFSRTAYPAAAERLIRALDAFQGSEPALDSSDGRAPSLPPIYVEDVVAFFDVVPRSTLWRVFALAGLGPISRAFHVVAMRPWSAFAYWGFMFTVLFVISMTLALSAGVELTRIPALGMLRIVATVAAISAIPAIPVALMKGALKRFTRKWLSDSFFWCPHRPLHAPSNVLLDHWDRVQPIVTELLGRPVDRWSEYMAARCPDPELAGRAYATLFVLLGVEFKPTPEVS